MPIILQSQPNSGTAKGKPTSVTQRGRVEPFELQVSRQDIAYHYPFELAGFSTVVGNTAAGPAWEGLTSSGGLYVYPGSAVVMTLVSTSAADTMVVQINGLDANFNMLAETITMNGTTGVNTVGSYLRINSIICLGSNNVGVITCKNGGTTYAQINASVGQSQMSVFTVPNGYTLYVYSVQGQGNAHYTTTVDFTVAEYNRQALPAAVPVNGYPVSYQAGSSTTLSQSPFVQIFTTIYQTPSPRPAGTDIQWTVVASVASPNTAAILVSGYLVANQTV
jgi:hypothetical protein